MARYKPEYDLEQLDAWLANIMKDASEMDEIAEVNPVQASYFYSGIKDLNVLEEAVQKEQAKNLAAFTGEKPFDNIYMQDIVRQTGTKKQALRELSEREEEAADKNDIEIRRIITFGNALPKPHSQHWLTGQDIWR